MRDIKLPKVLIISNFTFKEIYKSKLFSIVLFFSFLLLAVCLLAKELTYGVPHIIALDIGLGLMTLILIGIAIFLGVGLVSQEMEKRTLYTVLSRSVKRWEFIIGKFLGLALALFCISFILSSVVYTLFIFLGGEYSPLFFHGTLFIFLESLLVLSLVLLLSLIINPILSVIFVFFLYLAGEGLDGIDRIVNHSPVLLKLITIIKIIIPNFYKLNLKNYILYEQSIPKDFIIHGQLYAIFYLLSLILISIYVFNQKDLN